MPRKSSGSVRIFYPKLGKEELVSLLKEKVNDLSKELRIKLVTLFGSYAAGRYTAVSDVDVLAVIEGEHKDEAYRRIHDGLGINNLQLHLYTVDEYEILKRNSRSFVREAESKGVVIFEA